MEHLPAVLHSERLHGIAPSVRRARAVDVPALTRLINRAHQVEAAFFDGDRTCESEVRALADCGHFLVLDTTAAVAATAYVQIDGGMGRLELLSVAPELQGLGLGTRLVAVAEALCTALGCAMVRGEVVSVRPELGVWYRRRGYGEVGTAPYDVRPVRQPCHLIRMQKAMAGC